VPQFAVAALSERRELSRFQDRRSETAATEFKLRHYRSFSWFSFSCRTIWAMRERTYFRRHGLESQRTSTTTSLLTG